MVSVVQPDDTVVNPNESESAAQQGQFQAKQSESDSDFDLDSYLELPIMAQVEDNKVKLHKDFNDHQKIVEHLNTNVKKSWTARVHPEFEGKSILELNQMAGRKKYHQKQRTAFAQVSSKTNSKSKTRDFPTDFSWK